VRRGLALSSRPAAGCRGVCHTCTVSVLVRRTIAPGAGPSPTTSPSTGSGSAVSRTISSRMPVAAMNRRHGPTKSPRTSGTAMRRRRAGRGTSHSASPEHVQQSIGIHRARTCPIAGIRPAFRRHALGTGQSSAGLPDADLKVISPPGNRIHEDVPCCFNGGKRAPGGRNHLGRGAADSVQSQNACLQREGALYLID
jgi:hypothetical protein